ncbi:MAG: hypothetical protein K2X32_02505 [Phycisphaerales bacterium]|nr:hypothetical protein [Phycisphaerales bacterium]
MSDIPPPSPDSSNPFASPATAPPAPPSDSAGGEMNAAEIANGKVLAILSYVLPIVAIVVLFIRNNNFALYHAKQIVVPLILLMVMSMVGIALSFIPFVVCLTAPALLLGIAGFFVFAIMGLINAITDKAVPLPLTGRLAEQWFAGITKLPS